MLGEVLLQRLFPGKRQRPFTLALDVQAEEREARCRCANRHSVSTVGPIARIRQIVPASSPASQKQKGAGAFPDQCPYLATAADRFEGCALIISQWGCKV